VLRLWARIEAHDKVVADVVCGLQLFGGLGEEEGAPVCDTPNYAILLEHNLAGGFGDSKICGLGMGVEVGRREMYSLTSERRPGRT
jgi:hypothetical protein